MSVPMAIVDFIPVALFFVSTIILMRDLYHMMSKGAFALMAGGFIVVFMAGVFKATWKLLYALNVCDFAALNSAFFPMQSTGFVLAAIGLLALVAFPKQGKKTLAVAAPAVFSGTMIFVVLLILGTAGVSAALSVIAGKMKRKRYIVLFVLYLVLMLTMGYLSSRDFADPKMNWIGEGVNIIGQLLLFFGVLGLDKAGLETFELAK